MGVQDCRRCGNRAEKGRIDGRQCQSRWTGRKAWGLWAFSLGFSGSLLFLAGLLLWQEEISLSAYLSVLEERKTAALVNGEPIDQNEFEDRLRSFRSMLERLHGGRIFSGEAGKRSLELLKGEVLEVLVVEKLIGQEACRLGVRVSPERIQQELERIAREVFGGAEGFLRKPEWGGIRKEELRNQVKNTLLIEAIRRTMESTGVDFDRGPESWLIRARQSARVEISESFGSGIPGGPWIDGCCASTCGRRGREPLGPARGGSLSLKEEAEQAALRAFRTNNPTPQEISAGVVDYGCHLQVIIRKNGKELKSYTYRDGKIGED